MKIGTLLGKYLKCDDLGGRRVLVTIERMEAQKIEDEEKPVLYFVGKNKGLVLNRTNADSIIEITGTDETDEWEGKQIVLHPDKTKFGGKTVDCIRIATPQQTNTPRVPEPDPVVDYEEGKNADDQIPF